MFIIINLLIKGRPTTLKERFCQRWRNLLTTLFMWWSRHRSICRLTNYLFESAGGRLSLYKTNSSLSKSSLTSPWMREFPITAYGTCLEFAYRLLGRRTMLTVVLQPKWAKEEVLWKVESSESNNVWKYGRVSLGVNLEFRVKFRKFCTKLTKVSILTRLLF